MNGIIMSQTERTKASRRMNWNTWHAFIPTPTISSWKGSLDGALSAYTGEKENACLQTCSAQMHRSEIIYRKTNKTHHPLFFIHKSWNNHQLISIHSFALNQTNTKSQTLQIQELVRRSFLLNGHRQLKLKAIISNTKSMVPLLCPSIQVLKTIRPLKIQKAQQYEIPFASGISPSKLFSQNDSQP
jgi:hypothetical protein